MDTNLVGSACFGNNFEQSRPVLEIGEAGQVSDCFKPVLFVNLSSAALCRFPADAGIARQLLPVFFGAVNSGKVGLFDCALLELRLKLPRDGSSFSKDNDAGRVGIKAMRRAEF